MVSELCTICFRSKTTHAFPASAYTNHIHLRHISTPSPWKTSLKTTCVAPNCSVPLNIQGFRKRHRALPLAPAPIHFNLLYCI